MRVDDDGDFSIRNYKLILDAIVARFRNRFGLTIIGPIIDNITGIQVDRLHPLVAAAFSRVSPHADPLVIDTLITGLSYISLRHRTWLNAEARGTSCCCCGTTIAVDRINEKKVISSFTLTAECLSSLSAQ